MTVSTLPVPAPAAARPRAERPDPADRREASGDAFARTLDAAGRQARADDDPRARGTSADRTHGGASDTRATSGTTAHDGDVATGRATGPASGVTGGTATADGSTDGSVDGAPHGTATDGTPADGGAAGTDPTAAGAHAPTPVALTVEQVVLAAMQALAGASAGAAGAAPSTDPLDAALAVAEATAALASASGDAADATPTTVPAATAGGPTTGSAPAAVATVPGAPVADPAARAATSDVPTDAARPDAASAAPAGAGGPAGAPGSVGSEATSSGAPAPVADATGAASSAAAPAPAAPTTRPADVVPTQRTAPAEVPVLATQLGTRLVSLRTAPLGEHVMVLRVEPDSIGPVRVVAHIAKDGVRVELLGVTDGARDALRAALPDLRRDLVAAGLPSDLALGARTQDGAAQGRHGAPGQPGHPGDGDRGARTPGAPAGAGTGATTDAADVATPTDHRTARRGLDLVV